MHEIPFYNQPSNNEVAEELNAHPLVTTVGIVTQRNDDVSVTIGFNNNGYECSISLTAKTNEDAARLALAMLDAVKNHKNSI